MEIFRRILAVVVIIISAIFIGACLAGVFFSWSYNTPLTEVVTNGLTGIQHVLEAAYNGLDVVNANLADAQKPP